MFDIKITYSPCDSKFPLEFSASTASLLRTNTATLRHSEQNWTGYLYNKPLEYTQLVLSGEIEHYLSLGCDHGRLED